MNPTQKEFDEMLYATRTKTLQKIADAEGASHQIATQTTTVYTVAGFNFLDQRTALQFAIERNRRKQKKQIKQ